MLHPGEGSFPLRASEDQAARGGHPQHHVHPGCCSSGPGSCPVLLPPWGRLGPPALPLTPRDPPTQAATRSRPVKSSTSRVSLSQRNRPSWEASGPPPQAKGTGLPRQGTIDRSPAAQAPNGASRRLVVRALASTGTKGAGDRPRGPACLLWGRMRHTSAAHLPGSRGRRALAGVGLQPVSAKPPPPAEQTEAVSLHPQGTR